MTNPSTTPSEDSPFNAIISKEDRQYNIIMRLLCICLIVCILAMFASIRAYQLNHKTEVQNNKIDTLESIIKVERQEKLMIGNGFVNSKNKY